MDFIHAKAPSHVLWYDRDAWRRSLGLTAEHTCSGRESGGIVIVYSGDYPGLGGFTLHEDTPSNRSRIADAGGDVLLVFAGSQGAFAGIRAVPSGIRE